MGFQVVDDLKKVDELWEVGLIWWRRGSQYEWKHDKYVPGYPPPSQCSINLQFAILVED